MLTSDLQKDLDKTLAECISTLAPQTRELILVAVVDWLYDNGFVRVYSWGEAQLEYLNFLDEFYPSVLIDGLEIKASDIVQNLPGDTFNNMMTKFIDAARNGIIK